MSDVVIQNDITYLFIQWLGWDYNFWSVILADAIMCAAFFALIIILGFIGIVLGIIK